MFIRGPAARSVFTIVAPVERDRLTTLEDVLTQIQEHPDTNAYLRLSLDTFPHLHFASFVVFSEDEPEPLLVFENCVDGSRTEHLRQLARCEGIDQIFGNCKGYPTAPNEESRFTFLSAPSHCRSPQLYHVGTPYRTARSICEDLKKRTKLDEVLGYDEETFGQEDQTLKTAGPSPGVAKVLKRQVARLPMGTRQYWGWEIAAPWLALLVAVLALGLESRIVPKLMSVDWRVHPWWAAFWAADALTVFAVGAYGWSALWGNAVPILRKRVRPWAMTILVLTAALTALIVFPDLLSHFRNGHPVLVWVIPILTVIGIVASVRSAVRAQRSDRIAALRVSAPGASAFPKWLRMQETNNKDGEYERERRPGFFRTLWHFKWWLVPLTLVSVPVWLYRLQFAGWLFAGLMVTFVLKATWLAALTGWPASRTMARKTKGAAFVAFGTIIGAFLVMNLFELEAPRWLFAVLALAGLLLLWVFSVPSADQPDDTVQIVDTPEEWKRLATVTAQEDRAVQNHMSLDATVPQRWRRVALRIFLVSLNHLFYRSVLPDFWRGKLFGLPTVHCAQWVMLDGGRFVFLSNYDHTWGSYLDDFGAHLGAGIQKIWGQCTDNPGTGVLEIFKGFVRTRMVPYRVWYRAYPNTTLRQIWNTENLRTELTEDLSEEDIVRSIRRLGAAPKLLPEMLHAEQ